MFGPTYRLPVILCVLATSRLLRREATSRLAFNLLRSAPEREHCDARKEHKQSWTLIGFPRSTAT